MFFPPLSLLDCTSTMEQTKKYPVIDWTKNEYHQLQLAVDALKAICAREDKRHQMDEHLAPQALTSSFGNGVHRFDLAVSLPNLDDCPNGDYGAVFARAKERNCWSEKFFRSQIMIGVRRREKPIDGMFWGIQECPVPSQYYLNISGRWRVR